MTAGCGDRGRWRSGAGAVSRVLACASLVLLACGIAAAQEPLPLDQVAARRPSDLAPALEGERVVVRGTVSASPIQFSFFSHLPIQDDAGWGLVLEAPIARFASLQPGDRIEARGTISKRAGLPVLLPAQIDVLSSGPAPAPKRSGILEVQSLNKLGLLVVVDGRVIDKGENTGGEYLLIGEPRRPLKVFLPLPKPHAGAAQLRRFEIGDKVRVTGVASQYCPFPPYDRFFELIIADDDAVVLLSKRWFISPELFAVCLAAFVFAAGVWWMRERRMGAQRNMVRTFYGLGEETIGLGSPAEILKKLNSVLPRVLNVAGVHLYLYNRAANSLDRVSHESGPQQFSVPVLAPEGLLPLGPAVCFRNQALMAIPDTRRSPFYPDGRAEPRPRSVLLIPMFAETDLVGVLEIHDTRPMRDFPPEEKVLCQHLANQIAIALRLLEEKSIREQLSRSEKLAAVGQLISGVASDLRSPLDTISTMADLVAGSPPTMIRDELRTISLEAKKASEIVARLVSYNQPERVEAKRIELNTLLRHLIDFRRRAWQARGFEIRDVLCPSAVHVLGSQGQLERVFLDLLVHAEQYLADSPDKTLTIGTSVLARRAVVEIGYSSSPPKPAWAGTEASREPQLTVPGEALTRGIVSSHGGDLRLVRHPNGECRLEVELPLAPARLAGTEGGGARPFTCLIVDPDLGGRDELLKLLANRGCRLIPVNSAEEGLELVQRLRFDVVFCSVRLPGVNWVQFSERARPQVTAFVLLSEGFDYELSRGLISADVNVLAKPVTEAELDQVLGVVEVRLAAPEAAPQRPGLQIVRPERKVARS